MEPQLTIQNSLIRLGKFALSGNQRPSGSPVAYGGFPDRGIWRWGSPKVCRGKQPKRRALTVVATAEVPPRVHLAWLGGSSKY
ncbi:hypothetical protein [Brasilonema bromeliae]|uniref:Uncharacterized protein n=1 Tax=Brasilonema bromeliae SPC951 TaxID=385972 RepID=A0ABX1P8V4_9CYAN|nr:hypothetical protein [Brasilonema bromeliae]NMG20086.1 hypothetical protein [Brasilonema bromeliae SPC951]